MKKLIINIMPIIVIGICLIIIFITAGCSKIKQYKTTIKNETNDTVLVLIDNTDNGAYLLPKQQRILTTPQDMTGYYYQATIGSYIYQEGAIEEITVIKEYYE